MRNTAEESPPHNGPTVVRAEGALLERIVATTSPAARHGLSHKAFLTFEAAQTQTAWARTHQRRFALVEGGHVLAHTVRYDLTGLLDQRPAAICALGAVFGSPGHADAGAYADVLIEQLLKDATADGADLALLTTSPEAMSTRLAYFEAVPAADVELTVAESSRHGAPMTTVRGGADRDLAAIVEMGRVRAGEFRFHLDRDVDFVKHVITRRRLLAGLAPSSVRQLEFVIAEEGITAAAYVVISVFGGTWTIEECGDRDASGARVGALLQALIARAPIEARPVIRGWLPPGFVPPQVTVAPAVPARSTLLTTVLSTRVPQLKLAVRDVLYWHNDVF
jgi:hypothetical protein